MKLKFKILSLLFIIFATSLFAQNETIIKGSFYYPQRLDKWEYKHQLSLTLASLPEDYIEEANSMVYAPLFQYAAELGYEKGFALRGRFWTNIVTYNFTVGPRWSYRGGRLSAALGIDISYVFGQLKRFGFNNTIHTWYVHPNINLGIAFNQFTLTFGAEVNSIISTSQYVDSVPISSGETGFNGISIFAFIEQPFWSDKFLSIGLRMNYLQIYFPAWAVFPTWDRLSLIPEFIIGINL